MKPFFVVVFIAFLIAPLRAEPTPITNGQTVTRNGSFESDGGWSFMVSGAQCTGTNVTDQHHEGSKSFRLANKSPFAPHVYGRVYQTIPGLLPFTTYRISCFVKGKNAGIAWIGGGPGWTLRQHFPKGSFDWTEVSTEYSTGEVPPDFDLMIATEDQAEAIWIDEVKMVPIRADKEKQAQALRSITERLAECKSRLAQIENQTRGNSVAARDPYITLGLAVAKRFINRVENGSPLGQKQSVGWSTLQLTEVLEVLAETEKLLKSPRIAEIAWPSPGAPAHIDNGVFLTNRRNGKSSPFFFSGYGHFDSIERDLHVFKSLGASLVQDGRVGPSAMNQDGSLRPNALATLATLNKAAEQNIKVDWLLSPHYFPDWARAKAPGVSAPNIGFLNVNIDHPIARQTIETFTHKMTSAIKGRSALFSICLTNEPVYQESGRNPESRPAFITYLKDLHKNIATLNALHGSDYKSFEDVKTPPLGLPKETEARRAYYDWTRFNQHNHTNWHAWMRDLTRKNLPDIPTHAKIMVFQSLDRDKLHYGVDPELFCNAMDIAGCDAYAFPGNGNYDWHGHEFYYDLLNSFRNQPVFNSENHIIPDGYPHSQIPFTQIRAAMWQGALHHQGATTIWVWEEPLDPALTGSIYFRPASIYGAGRAFLDANRFANEVAAINQAKPRVALLYSWPSVFWQDAYKSTLMSMYSHLNFLGEKVTFISEQQLAEGRAAPVQVLLIPQATHVTAATIPALQTFIKNGGKIITIDDKNLTRDEYDRPHKLPTELSGAPSFHPGKIASASDVQSALHDMLAGQGLALNDLTDPAGKHTTGIEYRLVPHNGKTLMPLINFSAKPQVVRLPKQFEGASDLLSGEEVSTEMTLQPMVPHLLQTN